MTNRLLLILCFVIALAPSAFAGLKEADQAYGEGDYSTALREYRLVAEEGYPRAQFMLGFMYDKGLGVTQDYAEAVMWYRLAVPWLGPEHLDR